MAGLPAPQGITVLLHCPPSFPLLIVHPCSLPVIAFQQRIGIGHGDLHQGPALALLPDSQQALLFRAKLAAKPPVQGLVVGGDSLPAEEARGQILPVAPKQLLQPLIDRQVIDRVVVFLLEVAAGDVKVVAGVHPHA